MVYALDTNIVIHYLKNTSNVLNNINAAVARGDNLVIPRIVNYEIKRGFCVQSSPRKEATYKLFTSPTSFCSITDMDNGSLERAEQVFADLYNKRLTVGELDILIAAFCLENDYTLVTNNTKDFENIDGLVIEDWVNM